MLPENEVFRYEMRNAIDSIIKNSTLTKKDICEAGKSEFERILRKIYYSFCDYQKYPKVQVDTYMWTKFRKELKQTDLIHTNWSNWNTYIDQIDYLIPENTGSDRYYLVVDGGWVYEGTFSGIKRVLYEYPAFMEDFYLAPKDFAWLIVHCEDGECMFRVW